jgi:hypothetical protein
LVFPAFIDLMIILIRRETSTTACLLHTPTSLANLVIP